MAWVGRRSIFPWDRLTGQPPTQTLQRKIVEANALSMAADLVEEALGARKKPNAL
jgi:hypothetical protein